MMAQRLLELGDTDDIRKLISQSKKDLTEGKVSEEEFFNKFMEDAQIVVFNIFCEKFLYCHIKEYSVLSFFRGNV